ncbi:hypothetical protein LC55x_5257 [Lysobacter capsici]|uniref:hypothetical protein n=1 Tax=Lysobacter capsici TaxID=435897 RepID=UPI000722B3D5|nr:hypothetical protein [Lysobacter capsici]ALN88503.1 hypothetical protein LC55x_5257 [Lysobacter capsici]
MSSWLSAMWLRWSGDDMTIEQGRALLAQAKERLHSCRALGFFDVAFSELNREPKDGMAWYERFPHVCFLIAKWALASWRPQDDRPNPEPEDIRYVFMTTWDAICLLHVVDEHPVVFMRRMVLQQIWFQRKFDNSGIARQFRILGEMMAETPIAERFTEDFGLSPAQFAVQLAHMAADTGDQLDLVAMSEQRPVTARDPDHWRIIQAHYSRPVPELHREMSNLEARNTPAEVEVCEQSPLIATPFLLSGQGPVCIHHKLLFQTLTTAVFDLARSLGSRGFMNFFGPAFENYVAEVLADLNGHVVREAELMARLVGEGPVVDFALVSDNALVLIDAKGVEGHYDELYHNMPAVLAERLKTSLLRAVSQSIGTLARLPDDLRRADIYFICVTFKQLVVTDGTTLRELTRGTEEWDHPRWGSNVLTPGRMLFVSIYELECLVAYATATQVPLSHVVRDIVTANASPETRKALVEQHVIGQGVELLAPTCVQEAARRLRI